MNCRDALALIMDCVDYTNHACKPTEMVGAVLPITAITHATTALAKSKVVTELKRYSLDTKNGLEPFFVEDPNGPWVNVKNWMV